MIELDTTLNPDQPLLRDLSGYFKTVTSVPTWTPRNAYEQFTIYNGIFYVYDFTNGVWTARGGNSEYDNGNITGTATINWDNGPVQYATMTGNVTLTFTNPVAGARYLLHLAGAFTPTFPASVRWSGGTTATATATVSKKDIYTLIYSAKESLYDILQSPNYAIT